MPLLGEGCSVRIVGNPEKGRSRLVAARRPVDIVKACNKGMAESAAKLKLFYFRLLHKAAGQIHYERPERRIALRWEAT
jgi:hypothetical protein